MWVLFSYLTRKQPICPGGGALKGYVKWMDKQKGTHLGQKHQMSPEKLLN
ncbi:hypothetical protein PtA15_3A309 [Puccinia triticina]|uniref:Uncharacterized protein n=1 Tax=Puccinia triticina TaxID=208348 RepID=A0ABY7CE19_9BASI|nr:uncharacterized protein PtA15_3A309 [Puccinia triticina]WAQ82944.1 hypothetical protein PtA15_3A309 [Puccinia triticina]